MRLLSVALLVVLYLLIPLPSMAAQRVAVGAYHFPPYAIKPESAEPAGLLPELLTALNGMQDAYNFKLVATSAARRYRDLARGRIDLILFESPNWGWQDTPHRALDLHIVDAEVYVALAEPGRDQRYFDRLEGKRLALYSGYHYGFAGFNADPDVLGRRFAAILTYSHDSNLLMLLRHRADIAVVTRSYLDIYRQLHPDKGARLLVSDRVDQVYQHQALFRPDAPLTPQAFAGLLQALNRQGQLTDLLGRYHLALLQN